MGESNKSYYSDINNIIPVDSDKVQIQIGNSEPINTSLSQLARMLELESK